MAINPRRLVVLALLALVPVALFVISRERVGVLAIVSVLVIAWSLYTMFGASEPMTLAG